jgi:hypothetical protein
MGTFKQYISKSLLNERGGSATNADVIYQKLLGALDDAHIDFGTDMIEFHIGKVVKNSDVNIAMAIRRGASDEVRLGKNRDNGALTIVVETRGELPVRKEIDSFLAKDRDRAQEIKGMIAKYLTDHYPSEDPSLITTQYEDSASANTDIDTKYETLARKLREKMEDFKGMIEELQDEMNTEDAGKRAAAKRAIDHLAGEEFGNNVNEFKKKAMELLGDPKMIDKENRDKIEKRLESFYDQKIKPLLAK